MTESISIVEKVDNSLRVGSKIDTAVAPSIWEDLIPIVSNGTQHDVFMLSEIIAPIEYAKLTYFLRMLPKNDKVNLHINNPGGWVDGGFQIIGALNDCKAEVTAVLSGTVASVATIITMTCDKIKIADHTQFMIHSWSGGISGKAEEIRVHAAFSDKELTASFGKIYKGFLTKKEMKAVMLGTDMWMNKKEVLKRWARKVGKK